MLTAGRHMVMNVAIFGAFLLIVSILGVFLWQTSFGSNQHGQSGEKAEISHSEQKAGEKNSLGGSPAKHANNPTEEAIAYYTKWLAFFTFCLVLATIGLFVSGERNVEVARDSAAAARESADAAKKAADVAKQTMIAGQRAWIKLQIKPGNVMTLDENGASTAIAFEMTNIGPAPALHVTPHAWLGVFKNGGPWPWEEQKARCEEIRKQPIWGGFTIFPGDQFPSSVGVGRYAVGINVTKEQIASGLEISNDQKQVFFFVVGCVDYTFATDPTTHHQTGFVFDLRREPPKSGFSPDEGQIPQAELWLSEVGIGGMTAD